MVSCQGSFVELQQGGCSTGGCSWERGPAWAVPFKKSSFTSATPLPRPRANGALVSSGGRDWSADVIASDIVHGHSIVHVRALAQQACSWCRQGHSMATVSCTCVRWRCRQGPATVRYAYVGQPTRCHGVGRPTLPFHAPSCSLPCPPASCISALPPRT